MPVMSLHPLPANPTTGQQPSANFGARSVSAASSMSVPLASAAGGGGVSREVLKGLQDVAWSDDEDDPDCLVCAEPLDLSDLNFKPCQCGIQICQFCYNRLLTSDGRCPGCRRVYDATAVVFQPVDWEEVKRAKEKKTRRAKTIKQLDQIGRRHLMGVRIVMKNTVYVVGMKLPAAGDDAIPILRTNEYFGQYGKISRIYLRDRTATSSTSVSTLDTPNPLTSTGIYIVYVRREDAARAISALDGFAAPGGPAGTTLKANHGTTRYCDAFLRGAKCDTSGCTGLHEWGGEGDCFTKDDYEIALTRPAEYEARQKQATMTVPPLNQKSAWPKPSAGTDEAIGSALPGSASWGKPIGSGRTPARPTPAAPAPAATRSKSNLIPLTKNTLAFPLPTPTPIPVPAIKREKKILTSTMSRGRSTDSIPSVSGSNGPASPKKKVLSLTTSGLTPVPKVESPSTTPASSSAATVPPPPGIPTTARSRASRPTSIDTPAPVVEPEPESQVEEAELEPEPVEPVPTGDTGTESETGPSSSSPAPLTPSARSHADSNPLPPPLTSDPIFLHSPYEEPFIYTFPASDPDFSFELSVDPEEIRRMEGEYRPSPYSKLLVGLAEMGVLASDLAYSGMSRMMYPGKGKGGVGMGHDGIGGRGGGGGWTGIFRPFDAPSLEEFADLAAMTEEEEDYEHDEVEEQIADDEEEEEEEEGPRMTSRFDFARPLSRANSQLSLSRGQSPFNIRTSTQIRQDMGEGNSTPVASGSGSRLIWPPHMQHQQQQQQQQQLQSLDQLSSPAGGTNYYDSPGTERSWPITGSGMELTRPSSHRPLPPFDTEDHHSHRSTHSHSPLALAAHSYNNPHSQSQSQNPPGAFPLGLSIQQQQAYSHGPLPPSSAQSQQQSQRQYDARSLQAFHQQAAMRSGVTGQQQAAGAGYRRF